MQGIYEVELKDFVPIILEELIKLVLNQVNKGHRANNQISLKNVSAFVAAEAIICGYNLSPTAYFLAIKDGKRSFPIAPVRIDSEIYFEILKRLSGKEVVNVECAWDTHYTTIPWLIEFQRSINKKMAQFGTGRGQYLCLDDDLARTRSTRLEEQSGIPLYDNPAKDPTIVISSTCNDTQPTALPTNEFTPDSTHAAHQDKKVFIAYKKLQLGYQSSTISSRRLDSSLPHVPMKVEDKEKRPRCILCCRLCTGTSGLLKARSSAHERYGYQFSSTCLTCGTALCLKKRFLWKKTNKTCFELYHSLCNTELEEYGLNLCAASDPSFSGYHSMIAQGKPDKERLSCTTPPKNKGKIVHCYRIGCSEKPTHGYLERGKVVPTYCEAHKLEGMTTAMFPQPTREAHGEPCASTEQKARKRNPQANRKVCEFHGCSTFAGFNFVHEKARFCKAHQLPGMVRVRVEKLETSKPRGPYNKHKVASARTPVSGSIDARIPSKVDVPGHSPVVQERRQNPTSENPGARMLGLGIRPKSTKNSTFSANVFPGKKVRVVSGLQRRSLGHCTNVPIFICNAEGCHEIPIYGWPGTSTQHTNNAVCCAAHKLSGMVPISVQKI